MLHRSFKSAKCKTSLKLAMSRIKLLRNRRAAQVLQLKRELANLLESGQERTARIRVEHVIREEKTMEAYNLIEIYCELVAARLPIIESQKNCPIDLKESIASIIFASPRCSDVPELLDIRKHFTSKYGKEFISSAVELRPDCGVNRMVVEKLSAIAPDIQTKIKILSSIAQEHNIKWDHTLLEKMDSKPHDDLLNGPNTFDKASNTMHVESHYTQIPSQDQVLGTPERDSSLNSKLSTSSETIISTDIESNKDMSSDAIVHPQTRYEMGPGESDLSHPSSRGKNWNMEFKDATAAAEAAAESAEKASMAARAAAELSSIDRRFQIQLSGSGKSSRDASSFKPIKSSIDDDTQRISKPEEANFSDEPKRNLHFHEPEDDYRNGSLNASAREYDNGITSNLFSREDHRDFPTNRNPSNESDNVAVVFDDYVSAENHESDYPHQLTPKSSSWSPEEHPSQSPTKSALGDEDSAPLKFDDSDGNSDSDSEIENLDGVSSLKRIESEEKHGPTRAKHEPSDMVKDGEMGDGGPGLRFGTLSGGLRNKAHVRGGGTGLPPYIKDSANESSFKSIDVIKGVKTSSTAPLPYFDSDSDSEPESDRLKPGLIHKTRSGTAFSRRTKDFSVQGSLKPEISETGRPSGFGIHETQSSKTGHVHPKLPDYDALSAHLKSVQLNRK